MQLYDYEKEHIRTLRKYGAECTVLLKKDGCFPLTEAGLIALYGNGARRTIKGGTGSGEVNSRFFVTVEKGLKHAGFQITTNDWLDSYDKINEKASSQFKNEVRQEAKRLGKQPFIIGMGRYRKEPEYELELTGEGTTAIYVLSRISGEGGDREPVMGDILLTDTEVRDILACNDKYENFMLVINTGGVVDLSPVRMVKNILILSQLGVRTGDILADILLGRANPSGKLATTWSAWQDYSDLGTFGERNDTRYKEGIYVGYRYFDSMGKKALYPFGYGLSYSEFEIHDTTTTVVGDQVIVESLVTNTGMYAGKEVVELYVSAPEGKLDQPYQKLIGFAKTKKLRPQETTKVTVTTTLQNLASYDSEGERYVLEAGDYIVRVGNSSVSTTPCAVLRLEQEITTKKVKNVLGRPDFVDVKIKKEKCPTDDLSKVMVLRIGPDQLQTKVVEYTQPAEIDPIITKLEDEQLIRMNIGAFDPKGGIASMIGNSGFTVAGAAGQSYMDQITEGIPSMIMADGPAGVRVSPKYALDKDGNVHSLSLGLPESMLEFMPSPVRLFMKLQSYRVKKTDVVKEQYATALPIGTAIAQSFNIDFAEKCGDIVGYEMARFGVHLWLAPALNIHRSIQCGRNFEYYSEDPVISGEFTAAITRGVQAHPGCGVTIKHYAANNQEINRTQNNSQVSERAMREIYLKGFEIAVEKSYPAAVMTSYNLLNGVHTGEHRGLIEDILRCEFGHRGIVMTDWNVGNFMAGDDCVYPLSIAPNCVMAGNDLFMPGGRGDYQMVEKALNENTVTRQQLQINATRVYRMAKKLQDEKDTFRTEE